VRLKSENAGKSAKLGFVLGRPGLFVAFETRPTSTSGSHKTIVRNGTGIVEVDILFDDLSTLFQWNRNLPMGIIRVTQQLLSVRCTADATTDVFLVFRNASRFDQIGQFNRWIVYFFRAVVLEYGRMDEHFALDSCTGSIVGQVSFYIEG
jgi:hypothetical protein